MQIKKILTLFFYSGMDLKISITKYNFNVFHYIITIYYLLELNIKITVH